MLFMLGPGFVIANAYMIIYSTFAQFCHNKVCVRFSFITFMFFFFLFFFTNYVYKTLNKDRVYNIWN